MINQHVIWTFPSIRYACIIFIMLFQLGCFKEDKEIPMTGAMIFTEGTSAIYKFDLQTKKIDTILNTERNFFSRIVQISKDEFIINESRGLAKFDLRTSKIQPIRTGLRQTYVKEHKKLFFYDDIKGLKRCGLYMAFIDSLDQPTLIAKAPDYEKTFVKPVQISIDEIVFIGEDNDIWKYDIALNLLTSTGISGDYKPGGWIRSKNILLCNMAHTWDIYEVDLKTKNKKSFSAFKNIINLEYIEKYDVAIYCKESYGLFGELSGTYHDLYVYSFKEGANYKLAANVMMHSAVYIDE